MNGKSKFVCTGINFHKKWILWGVLGWEIAANLPYRASGTITITVQRPYAHIWPYGHMGIWAYGHMGIWAYAKKIWPNGVSPKRESKIQLRDVNQRSLGHSNQKLWPKVDLGEFHHLWALKIVRHGSFMGWNFFVAFSDHITSAVCRTKPN